MSWPRWWSPGSLSPRTAVPSELNGDVWQCPSSAPAAFIPAGDYLQALGVKAAALEVVVGELQRRGSSAGLLNPVGKILARRGDPGGQCAIEVRLSSPGFLREEKRDCCTKLVLPCCPQPPCSGPVTAAMQGTGRGAAAGAKAGSGARARGGMSEGEMEGGSWSRRRD